MSIDEGEQSKAFVLGKVASGNFMSWSWKLFTGFELPFGNFIRSSNLEGTRFHRSVGILTNRRGEQRSNGATGKYRLPWVKKCRRQTPCANLGNARTLPISAYRDRKTIKHGVFLRLQTPPIGPLPIFARVTYRWKELLSPVLSGFKLSCNFSFCYGLELNLVAYCKVVSIYKKDLKILSFQSNIFAIIIAKILGFKIFIRSNTSPISFANSFLKKLIFKYFFNLSDKIIVNSKEFKNQFYKFFNRKPVLI